MTCKKHISKYTVSPKSSKDQAKTLSVLDVIRAYKFPTGKNLENRKVAVIELGGGQRHADIYWFCDQLKVKHPQLKDHSVGFAHNGFILNPADGEVALDQCIIAGACPGIQIHTVYAPNTDKGFAQAITFAADNIQPDAISISWGAAEPSWSADGRQAMDAAMQAASRSGIAVYCAAGDDGSNDNVGDGKAHVDFPASSPFAIGCGGTRLVLDSEGKRSLERVWDVNDGNGSTGGGVSSVYPPLSLPGAPKLAGRGVPDIAGNADPQSGYKIKSDFINQAFGGTSAVAPLMAALHCILQSYCYNKLGDLRPMLYSAPSEVFFDVVQGSNGACSAGAGWDSCSGLGVPDGTALLNHLMSLGLAG